ncbi:hypothetical protein FHS51_004258 [Sphingobium wenxiniae]|nr:hypothetical protein [Sphingobium wenxiniae]
MATAHLFVNRHCPQSRRCLEQRYNLILENIGNRIGAAAAPWRISLHWQHRFVGKAIPGRDAEACLYGSSRDRMGLSKLHKQPHLMIVDVAT